MHVELTTIATILLPAICSREVMFDYITDGWQNRMKFKTDDIHNIFCVVLEDL